MTSAALAATRRANFKHSSQHPLETGTKAPVIEKGKQLEPPVITGANKFRSTRICDCNCLPIVSGNVNRWQDFCQGKPYLR